MVMSMMHADIFPMVTEWMNFSKDIHFGLTSKKMNVFAFSFINKEVIKERSLIKVISTICRLIDEQSVNN